MKKKQILSNLKYTFLLVAGAQALDLATEANLATEAEAEKYQPTYYRSGSIGTNENFKFGRFTARIKGANKDGTVTSFFLFCKGPHWNYHDLSEIDIEIVPTITRDKNWEGPFHTNLIYENHLIVAQLYPTTMQTPGLTGTLTRSNGPLTTSHGPTMGRRCPRSAQ